MREYDQGPLRRYWGGAELAPTPSGTRVRVYSSFTPRHPLLRPLIWAVLATPAMLHRLKQLAINPMPMTPADMDKYVVAELSSNEKLIRAAGIK